MSAIVAIVGRPNVGKSTLFNRLTGSRRALVDDLPGVTRDRLYGKVKPWAGNFMLVDTGGFDPPADQAFASEVHAQVELAMAEADLIVFLTDGRLGLSPLDQDVARRLRGAQKPVVLAVNKIDGVERLADAAEFHSLGIEPLVGVSAAHGFGVGEMLEEINARLPEEPEIDEDDEEHYRIIRVGILGRPNAGKSSLLNALVGEERVVVSPTAGTTRDAVDTPLSVGGRDYVFIDTAGIRRPGKVARGIEKAGVFRSLRTLERCHVAVVLMDASEGVTDRDLRISGQATEAGRALVFAINKWDLMKGRKEEAGQILERARGALKFAPWAPVIPISAKTGVGVSKLLTTVTQVFTQYNTRLDTGPLNRGLQAAMEKHPPPMVKGRRLKFYFATQVSVRPPTVVIFVNNPKAVHFSYIRYLKNELAKLMGLDKAPLRMVLKQRQSNRRRR